MRTKLDMPQVRHAATWCMIGALILLGVAFHSEAPAATSSSVAYVYDFGTGSNDTSGLGTSSSIFFNALTGAAAGGSYATADATLTVSITDVPVSTIDASPSTALSGFDTVILYQVCDIGSHPNTMTAVNNFLSAGGKVLIFDGDRCSGFSSYPPPADYSTFLFPFTASTPGPQGKSGSYTLLEASPLTSGLVLGVQSDDSVGDANTFVTFNPAWCASITAKNTLGNEGFVEAYARTPNSPPGLVIYEGEDFWFTFGPTPHLRLVFDNMLKQPFNPDGLPCTLPASLITLAPPAQTICPPAKATVTATVKDVDNVGKAGVTVTFTVTSGPNSGASGAATTDASGNASFSYPGTTAGTDKVIASFVDSLGGTHHSNTVDVVWQCPPTALCKNVTIAADSTCHAAASVNNGSFDADGEPVTVSQVPTVFTLGTTLAMLTATDSAGLTATCTGAVKVFDDTPPMLTCPAPVVLECTGPSGATATFSPTATDNCGIQSSGCVPASGSNFPNGVTAVSCSANDTSGNSASCGFSVKVVDTTPPTVSCVQSVNPGGKNIPSAGDNPKSGENPDGFYQVLASDLCSASPAVKIGGYALVNGETIKITQSPGKSGVRLVNTMGQDGIKHFQVGPGDAVIMATDGSGNMTSVTCLVPPPPK